MSQATLPFTEERVVRSNATGDSYRLLIARPDAQVPEEGFPVVYLLDGNGCFGTCLEAMRRMSRRPDATGVAPTVIVGVGSPDNAIYSVEQRQRDYTTPVAEGRVLPERGAENAQNTGGAGAFLAFLEDELKPSLLADFPIDLARQTLFGHSLAGYFALWVLANRPRSFRKYAAISPSIWWDQDGLTRALLQADLKSARLLMAVGEFEEKAPAHHREAVGETRLAAHRGERNMMANARDLSAALSPLFPAGGFSFEELAGEDHASIVSAAMPRVLRLAARQ